MLCHADTGHGQGSHTPSDGLRQNSPRPVPVDKATSSGKIELKPLSQTASTSAEKGTRGGGVASPPPRQEREQAQSSLEVLVLSRMILRLLCHPVSRVAARIDRERQGLDPSDAVII